MSCHQPESTTTTNFIWDSLPQIPDPTGFAGSFAGTIDNHLIVAGGSNFPDGGAPWKGSTKKWYDNVYFLSSPDSNWRLIGNLKTPLGYGCSITTPKGMLIIGGSNEQGHESSVLMLRLHEGKLVTDSLPSLPFTIANSCGTLINNVVYLAGGLESPDATTASSAFLALDLSDPVKGWKRLESWPGPARMLAVAGKANGEFYLFSGTELINGKRHYLKDAYVYNPQNGWRTIADLPKATVAAPGPAWNSAKNEIYIFGGDDGSLADSAAALQDKHPGFSNQILMYDPKTDSWAQKLTIPVQKNRNPIEEPNNSSWAPVTTALVQWNNLLVFPGGEVRPGTRTPKVRTALPENSK